MLMKKIEVEKEDNLGIVNLNCLWRILIENKLGGNEMLKCFNKPMFFMGGV